MKLDSTIKEFTEKYDREAMKSIDTLSKDHGLSVNGYTINVFNINEAFNTFDTYIRDYAEYMIKNMNNPKRSPRDEIQTSVRGFIENHIFKNEPTTYPQLPNFVNSYVEGVNKLIETVEDVKRTMLDAGIDPESVGDINEFTDIFVDKLHESFDPTMDRILWASGYNTRKALFGKKETKKPVFL